MPRPRYGQVVVGPPGAGKTTFCDGMQQYLNLLKRNAVVINLDPANEGELRYDVLYDVCKEAVSISSVMEETGLGPNGGLIYSMEYLEAHIDEIISSINGRLSERSYLLFDLPGQVELYTHSACVHNILHKLAKVLDLRLTAVQLIDAHYCTDATKFISAALLGTTTMLRLELPVVSVLSKVDLLTNYGEIPFQLDYFTECQDLDRLIPFLNDPSKQAHDSEDLDVEFDIADDPDYQRVRRKREQSTISRKRAKLHAALAEVVGDFGLLSFLPLDISSAESVARVLAKIDKANGYVFTEASVNEDLFKCAIKSDTDYEAVADIRERISSPEKIKELNRTNNAPR